jgi:hypothetical protein
MSSRSGRAKSRASRDVADASLTGNRESTLRSPENRKTDLDRKYEAFASLTALEMAYAVADIFPVTVSSGRPSEGGPTR